MRSDLKEKKRKNTITARDKIANGNSDTRRRYTGFANRICDTLFFKMKTNIDVKKVAIRTYRRPPGGIGEATKSISVGLYLSLTHNTMFVKKKKEKTF